MIIRVGSKNPVKVEAVQECFPDFEVEGVEVDSGVDEQPKSLGETMEGARTRSELCQGDADCGIGIESGVMESAFASSGWINTVACSIWDGKNYWVGMASGFVVPEVLMRIVFRDNVDLSEAALRAGFTKDKRVGYGVGIVNVLTDGKMSRKPYIKQAIEMAMIQMNHPELYM